MAGVTMLSNCSKSKVLAALITFSFLATSFGGVFAPLAAAADVAASEEAIQTGGPNGGLLAAIAAVGLVAVLSRGGSSDGTSSSSKTTAPGQTSNTGQTSNSGQSGTTGSGQTTTTTSASEEQQALTLLNKDRAANGLPALQANSQLTQLARNYANDMISRGFFSHYNPEGLSPFDRMQRAGISYKYAGENLAINTSVATAENAFMTSAGHRANILNTNYNEVGIGVVHNTKGQVYVVQEFIGK
jgi:Uncharacterized protein with SCP/PR1 domains